MSTNAIFDIIEDSVVSLLEMDLTLPDPITIYLPKDQFREFIRQGLTVKGVPLAESATRVVAKVAGVKVVVLADPDPVVTH